MVKYVGKRLLIMIPILLGVTFIVFSLMSLIPTNPGQIIVGPGGTQADIDMVNQQLGYNLPFFERYVKFLYDAIVNQDFGTSYYYKMPVMQMILERLPITFRLTIGAIMVSIIIGIPLGILSAVKQYSLIDTIPTVTAMFLAAVPSFLTGMILLLVFSLVLDWLPSSGAESWRSYILPMLALGINDGAQQMRFTRSSMLETIRQDYVRTARAKGATEMIVIWKHALKNALLPVITCIGNNFGGLLGGTIVAETLFALPGNGTLIVTAIKQADVPVVLAGVTVLAFLFSFIMLSVDILYAFADPRIKAKYAKRRA